MDYLLVVLQILFFVPILVRATGRVGGDAERNSIVQEIVAGFRRPALVLHGSGVLLLWAGVALALLGGRVPRGPTTGGVLGAAVLLGGTALMTWSVAALRSWRLLPKIGAGHELCTSGPYGLVRHPIYLALDLLGAGSALWVKSPATVVAAGLIVISGNMRARLEEKVLIEAYGDRYREYMRRVRGLIPFLY